MAKQLNNNIVIQGFDEKKILKAIKKWHKKDLNLLSKKLTEITQSIKNIPIT